MQQMKPKVHYINNESFLLAMEEYQESVSRAKLDGLPKPIIPNYIGECVVKIAHHLAQKPNFMNYTYKEDMIADAIENCIKYIDNFDSEKSKNPFAYFTQITYYAFIRRIQKEKKQTLIKCKIIAQHNADSSFFDLQDVDSDQKDQYSEQFSSIMDTESVNNVLIKDIESRQKKKMKKSEPK